MDKGFDAHESAHPAATGQINIVGGFEVQTDSVLADLRTKPCRRYRVTGIVLTPQFVDLIEVSGTDGEICFIAEIALRIQKVEDIVAAPLDGFQIGGSSGADRKLIAVPQQPLQAIQTP